MTDSGMAGRVGDERGLLGIPVLKIVVGLLLVLVLGYEAGAVMFARAQAADMAQVAAQAAASAWRDTGSRDETVGAAVATLRERDPNARLARRSLSFSADGEVTLTVVKRARTLIVQHLEFLEGFRTARATATAGPSTL